METKSSSKINFQFTIEGEEAWDFALELEEALKKGLEKGSFEIIHLTNNVNPLRLKTEKDKE